MFMVWVYYYLKSCKINLPNKGTAKLIEWTATVSTGADSTTKLALLVF